MKTQQKNSTKKSNKESKFVLNYASSFEKEMGMVL